MRRWLLRILVIFVVLTALGFLCAHLVLRSDLPRRIVLDILRQETGLTVHAASLETGWAGKTVVRDLTVTLPLEQDPFLRADELRIDHTTLISLAFTRMLRVHDVEICRPDVTIKPDSHGDWNLLRAAEIIAEAQAEKAPDPTALDRLPRLRIAEAIIHIAGPDGALHTHDPITIEGDPIGALAWGFNIDYAPAVRLEGRIAPRAGWQHHLAFDINQIRGLIEPWVPDAPEVLSVAGRWQGHVKDAVLIGTLQLDDLQADQFRVRGGADVEVPGQRIVLKPRGLVVSVDDDGIDPLHLHNGTISTDGIDFSIDRLHVSSRDTMAHVNGGWSVAEESGNVRIRWSGREQAWEISHEGVIDAQLALPAIGRKSINATIEVDAESAFGDVDARLVLAAKGREWSHMSGSLLAERLTLRDREDFLDLSDTVAHIDAPLPTVTLTQLRGRDGRLTGEGTYNVQGRTWSLTAHARDWQLPGRFRGIEARPIDLELAVNGTWRDATIERLEVVHDDMALTASGRFAPDKPEPLQLEANLETRLPLQEGQPVAGDARTSMRITGTIVPMSLDLSGQLHLDDVTFLDRPLNPIEADWRGAVSEAALSFNATVPDLFDGTWSADGAYEFMTRDARLDVKGSNARVEQFAQLSGLPVDLAGRADADVNMTLPNLDLNRLAIDGRWEATELKGAGLLEARGGGLLTVRGLFVRVHQIQLAHQEGRITGEATMRLDAPDRAWFDVQTRDWPIDLPAYDLAGTVNGSLAVDVDLRSFDAHGALDIVLDLALAGEALGQFDLLGTISDRTLTVEHLQADAFAGSLSGEGNIVLAPEHWKNSELAMEWSEVDLAQLSKHLPITEPLAGICSGTLDIQRSDDPRAHEPMAVNLSAHAAEGRFGKVHLEGLELAGYFGPDRLIATEARLGAVDGEITLTARLTRHDGEPHVHVHSQFERLNIEQIVHQLEVTDEAMPGLAAGRFSGGGYLRSPHRLFGRADVTLSESDLIGLPGFTQLYSLLNLDLSPQPTGAGDVQVRLEGNSVEMSRMTYFNRGTDVVARLRVEDVRLGRNSPIAGIAAGVIRPLRDIDLPLIGDLDRLIGAVQVGSASVRIGGTLQSPSTSVVPFAEITGALRRILGGRIDE